VVKFLTETAEEAKKKMAEKEKGEKGETAEKGQASGGLQLITQARFLVVCLCDLYVAVYLISSEYIYIYIYIYIYMSIHTYIQACVFASWFIKLFFLLPELP
jgi:hypothetical protein